ALRAVGPDNFAKPGVVELRDAGIVEPAERFRLDPEAIALARGRQARAAQLDRRAPPRRLMESVVHRADAALADHRADHIIPNPQGHGFGAGGNVHFEAPLRRLRAITGSLIGVDQPLDVTHEPLIAAAPLGQGLRASLWRQIDDLQEDLLDRF